MTKNKIQDKCRFCSGIIPVNERQSANGRCGECAYLELRNQIEFNEKMEKMDLLKKGKVK